MLRTIRAMSAGALAIGALAVQGASGAEIGVTDSEITIGMFAPLSGPLAGYGVDPVNAARLWYDEVNAKGGIHGRKIRVIAEDDKCNSQEAVAVVTKLVTVDKVFMLNGGSCSTPVLAVQEFVTREKVPLSMLIAAGDAAVFPPTRYVFGAYGGTQTACGAIMMNFVAEQLTGKRVALIVHDDEFGQSFRSTATAAAKIAGIEIVAIETLATNVADVTAAILNIRAASPDVIVSGGYPAPAVLIAKTAHELGITTTIIQANQGLPDTEAFAKNVGDAAALSNFYYNNPLNDLFGQGMQKEWIDKYKVAYPERNPTAYMLYGLPSAMAITRALEAAGPDLTREKFVDAMEELDFDTGIMAGNIAFSSERRDAMRNFTFVKFDGTTHTLQPGTYAWDGSKEK